MSSSSINRKDFLVLTVSTATIATFLEACGDDPVTPSGTAGTGTGGTGAAGTPATGGTGTAGTGTAGTGTAGTGTAGTGTAGTGTAGSGGSSAGTGGASGGSGGASGGSGGGSAGTGGGGGGGMCGTASIMQTLTTAGDGHDHIPSDATELMTLKTALKTHINGANSTMDFTMTGDNHTHKFKLTADQVTTLKSGMTVTGIVTDGQHTHTYKIECTA